MIINILDHDYGYTVTLGEHNRRMSDKTALHTHLMAYAQAHFPKVHQVDVFFRDVEVMHDDAPRTWKHTVSIKLNNEPLMVRHITDPTECFASYIGDMKAFKDGLHGHR